MNGGASQFNPAMLLNPRAYPTNPVPQAQRMQAPMQQSFSHNMRPQEQQSQPVFTFDSPFSQPSQPSPQSRPSSLPQQQHSQQQQQQLYGNGFANYANGGGMGMAHMLERANNVVSRDMVPQKRQKLHDDGHERKPTFAGGGGSSGILGKYMKEKREEGMKNNASSTVIDLSAGWL